ncbi:CAP10 domain-containing protein [Mycena kentingensis (nom. inval.)]|nr:CAP10 domain-containing protein [Mycena kentingensis (nom. inval.)]
MATSWFPKFAGAPREHSNGHSNGDSSHPLLPTNGRHDPDDDDFEVELEMGRYSEQSESGTRAFVRKYKWYLVAAGIGLLLLLATSHYRSPQPVPQFIPGPWHDFSESINAQIDRLLARQSSTLEQAKSRYRLKNQREPPPGYDKWYQHARETSCLIDEYTQIARDFEPFYQLAAKDPKFFARAAERAANKVKKDGVGMTTGAFEKHQFKMTDSHDTLYRGDWERTFRRFENFIPDASIILNGRDEPRSLFNTRKPDMLEHALNASDKTPFEISPRPTDSFFRDEMQCIIPNRQTGFTGPANDASGFMLFASSTQFATDLLPVLSMTKIAPCFSDILVPSEFYYSDCGWSPKYSYPDNVNWTNKIPQLYWRGMTSGGWIWDDNYRAFPRFRLIDIGKTMRGQTLLDVAISGFHGDLCSERCDGKKIEKEYGVTHKSAPREEGYKYKYVVDLDGNSFSGRYLGLLKSGSLVFKSTVFAEFFNDWIRPYEHYIPVLPDLSDLLDKVEWARAHDAEARRIQQTGELFTKRIMTDQQNDCYFSLVLLEWARLQGLATAAEPSHKLSVGDGGEGEAMD